MFIRTVLLIIIFCYGIVINAMAENANKSEGCKHNFGKGCQISTSGQIHFNQGKSPSKSIPLTLNNDMNGQISLHHSKANQVDSVRGGFLLNNHSNKNVAIKYHVVLKDSKGPIAQTKGSFYLKPGSQKVKISNIVLHHRDINNISSYEIKMSGV